MFTLPGGLRLDPDPVQLGVVLSDVRRARHIFCVAINHQPNIERVVFLEHLNRFLECLLNKRTGRFAIQVRLPGVEDDAFGFFHKPLHSSYVTPYARFGHAVSFLVISAAVF